MIKLVRLNLFPFVSDPLHCSCFENMNQGVALAPFLEKLGIHAKRSRLTVKGFQQWNPVTTGLHSGSSVSTEHVGHTPDKQDVLDVQPDSTSHKDQEPCIIISMKQCVRAW